MTSGKSFWGSIIVVQRVDLLEEKRPLQGQQRQLMVICQQPYLRKDDDHQTNTHGIGPLLPYHCLLGDYHGFL